MNHIKTARAFAELMDSKFKILGIPFGLDTIIGLVPGLGDLVTLILSTYLLWIGYRAKLPPAQMRRMVINIVIDTVVGSIPLLGDIGDLFFKANLRNLKILESYRNGEFVQEGEILS